MVESSRVKLSGVEPWTSGVESNRTRFNGAELGRTKLNQVASNGSVAVEPNRTT